jgi:putative transposase
MCRWLRLRRSDLYDINGVIQSGVKVLSEACIVDKMKGIRKINRSWGFRMIFAYMRNQGDKVSKRRAYRHYQRAKLSLHRNPKKPRIKRAFQKLLPPEKINEGWAVDFLSEWVVGENQQSVRVINVIDERSRKDLWVEAAHSINANKLVEVLDRIVEMRGLPRYIRCDNGPEFISQKLKEWAFNKVEIKYIQPGKPTQNGIIERLNGTVRRECLSLNWFHSLDEINELLGHWFKTYNFDRPHSCLKYQTPHTFEKLNQSLYYKVAPGDGG